MLVLKLPKRRRYQPLKLAQDIQRFGIIYGLAKDNLHVR